MASVNLNTARRQLDPDSDELRLIKILQNGLPLAPRPYLTIAEQTGLTETRVMELINGLIQDQTIKRFGVVIRHHEAGYRANAMIVWDVPDSQLTIIPQQMRLFPFITLCYRRPRQLPEWPYNLFCMIHGHDRASVLKNLHEMITSCGWQDLPHAVLFSKRRFKQRGAKYVFHEQSSQPNERFQVSTQSHGEHGGNLS